MFIYLSIFSHEIRQINVLYEILSPWVNEKAQRMYTHVVVIVSSFLSHQFSEKNEKNERRERTIIFTCELFDIVFHKLVKYKKIRTNVVHKSVRVIYFIKKMRLYKIRIHKKFFFIKTEKISKTTQIFRDRTFEVIIYFLKICVYVKLA